MSAADEVNAMRAWALRWAIPEQEYDVLLMETARLMHETAAFHDMTGTTHFNLDDPRIADLMTTLVSIRRETA